MSTDTLLALVLRRWDQGESDRRLAVLTMERGKIDVVAKGARKSGSRLAAASEPLSFIRIQLAAGKRTNYVTQADPQRSFPGLRTDYSRLTLGLAYAELVSSAAQHDQINTELFQSAIESLHHLESHDEPLTAFVWGALKLMELEGLLTQFDVCVISGKKVGEDPAWVSPTAGGYVSPEHASEFGDRFLAPAAALIGLSRTAELLKPPDHLRSADECARVLSRFWLHIAGTKLPALESAISHVSSQGC